MDKPIPELSIDEGVALFTQHMQRGMPQHLADMPASTDAPMDQETFRFHMAERLINSLCPDPRQCGIKTCRRSGRCEQLQEISAWKVHGSDGRRSPGAHALRHAMWLYALARLT